MIKPRQNGADLDKLTAGMRQFALEMIADVAMNGTEAARRAGYKHPAQAAARLMKNKSVKAALGKAMRLRSERTGHTGDEVLGFVHFALFFNPDKYFKPAKGGGWVVPKGMKLPDEIGQIIVEVAEIEVVHEDGTLEKQNVIKKFIDKHVVAPLVMKHHGLLTDKIEATVKNQINWDGLLTVGNGKVDPIKQAILDVSSEPLTE